MFYVYYDDSAEEAQLNPNLDKSVPGPGSHRLIHIQTYIYPNLAKTYFTDGAVYSNSTREIGLLHIEIYKAGRSDHFTSIYISQE